MIERSVVISDSESPSVEENWLAGSAPVGGSATTRLSEKPAAQEREITEAALAERNGRVSGPRGAAVKLGIPQSTLDSKIKARKNQ